MRFLPIFLLVLFNVLPASAAGIGACDAARSTADIMKCLTRQHEQTKQALNSTFDKVSQSRSGEALTTLKQVQADWLSYRDRQCDMEAGHLNTESLRRLESLKCMIRMTDERVAALSVLAEQPHEGMVSGIKGPPRWMNVLSKENPDIFWRYGSRLQGDVDCDGQDEFIMPGMAQDPKAGKPYGVIAISENPATGKPGNTLITVKSVTTDIVNEETGRPDIIECGFDLKVGLVDLPSSEADSDLPQACSAGLSVIDLLCPAMVIQHEDGRYKLSITQGKTQ